MHISNTDHKLAIKCAQDIVIALVMLACSEISDTEVEQNFRRSKRELDAALKRLRETSK